jgi:hypothetical protein
MSESSPRYHHSVVRDMGGPGYVDVALVRSAVPHGVLSHLLHHERGGAIVIYHRSFRPLLELSELEAYAGQLEQVAAHGNAGTLGCFVDICDQPGGIVQVALYERWFDGVHLRCERLAVREFEAAADHALVDSAEFVTELRAWAEQRNDERDASDQDARDAETERTERAIDRAEAARELAQLLNTVDQRD